MICIPFWNDVNDEQLENIPIILVTLLLLFHFEILFEFILEILFKFDKDEQS